MSLVHDLLYVVGPEVSRGYPPPAPGYSSSVEGLARGPHWSIQTSTRGPGARPPLVDPNSYIRDLVGSPGHSQSKRDGRKTKSFRGLPGRGRPMDLRSSNGRRHLGLSTRRTTWQGLVRVRPLPHRAAPSLAKRLEQTAIPSPVAADARGHPSGRSESRSHGSPATPNRRGPHPHAHLDIAFHHGIRDVRPRVPSSACAKSKRTASGCPHTLRPWTQKLNSNQAVTPDHTFSLETTVILTLGPGRGHGKRYRPAQAVARGIVKHSIIRIKNRDQLCCARAIVTIQAWADDQAGEFPPVGYKTLKNGRPSQERQAKELHRLAGVPEEPCGHPELEQFQAVLPDYHIKVISIDPLSDRPRPPEN